MIPENDLQIEAAFYREMGRKLFDKRMSRKMSRETLANEVGCHRNTVMRWENGESDVPVWMFLRVCDILSCQHLLLLPSRDFTWGRDYLKAKQERDQMRKQVESERDPRLTDKEINHLRRPVA